MQYQIAKSRLISGGSPLSAIDTDLLSLHTEMYPPEQ